ncbi:MAG TPA: NADH-quinone oxidoreductase subunit C [Mucilaginibacter sp.]|jgi:NADH-quinone oxidoreductase subunit C|nr:NADH-quinone oxidoreductase subunit C [Mucilaginibacter sp.]
MSFEQIKSLLIAKFGSDIIVGEETGGLQPALLINPDQIVDICRELRDNPLTYFDFLSCLTGVDYGADAGRFGVVYHLASIPYQTQLTLKAIKEGSPSEDELPSFPSITSVYGAADWHEREAYEMIGIFFEGHPDLRKLLLPDDWEGFPLRKDYTTVDKYYKGIKID